MKNAERGISFLIMFWIFLICTSLAYIVSTQETSHIFQVGPNPTFYILGICIDNFESYTVVVIFCFVNSGVRTINHNFLQSWIINMVQDPKTVVVNKVDAYTISFISTIYNWVDFFMYMNILLSQIDMLLIEISADLIMNAILTTYYLRSKNNITNDIIL